MKWRHCALLALPWGVALAGPPAPAVPAHPAAATDASATADADLLEFLGSVDSSVPGWHDYLEHTDLEKVIHAPSNTGPPTKPGNST
jgi:hypothetical protein